MTASLDEFFSVRTLGRVRAEDVSTWRTRLAQHPNASARELMSTLAEDPGSGGYVLSEEAWGYIGQIPTLADMSEDLSSFELGLAELEQQASTMLFGTDLEAVYAVSSVAASSAEYWDANYDHWAALCGDDPSLCTGIMAAAPGTSATIMRVNGWKVLGADIVGCAGGFILGGWPGCAVGAGVASANSIIGQL